MNLHNLTDDELYKIRDAIEAEIDRRRIASYTDPVEAAVYEACNYNNFTLLQPLYEAYHYRLGNHGAPEITRVEEDIDGTGNHVLLIDSEYDDKFDRVPVKWLKHPDKHIDHREEQKAKALEAEVARSLKDIERLTEELAFKRRALEINQTMRPLWPRETSGEENL